MAGLTKTNSDLLLRSDGSADTFYTTANLGCYEINPASALTADTQSGGSGTAITEGTIRKVARAINSLIFEVKSDGDVMIAICDNSQQDAASIKSKVDDALGVTNTTVTKLTTLLGLA
jgi:hypothetical protein